MPRRAPQASGGLRQLTTLYLTNNRVGAGGARALGGALGGAAPRNFLPCGFVPQLDVLPLCDAFVTHGGAGSVMEAIAHRVPMAVVPCFGDQMWNADRVAAAGIGASFRYPIRALADAAALRDAALALSDPSVENPYRRAIDAVATKMERTGGPERAADLVLAEIAKAAIGGDEDPKRGRAAQDCSPVERKGVPPRAT